MGVSLEATVHAQLVLANWAVVDCVLAAIDAEWQEATQPQPTQSSGRENIILIIGDTNIPCT